MADVTATTAAPAGTRQTRSATGHSKPRIFAQIESALSAPKKKRSPKANTAKPRANKTTGGRVGKTTTTTTKKGPIAKVEEKVNGAVEKLEGEVEGKPGKKGAGTKKLKGETTTKKTAPKTKAAVKV